MRFQRLSLGVAVLPAAALVMGVPTMADAAPRADLVQIVAVNDLHSRIGLPAGSEGRVVVGPGEDSTFGTQQEGESDDEVARVGGAANLATTLQQLRTDFRLGAGGSAASFFVAAGDLIGAGPPEFASYRDEPTIEIFNALGLDVSSVGDDEFNNGTGELRRISAASDGSFTDDVTACQGVTPGVDGCFGEGEHAFTGAQFPYLAANVVSRRTGEPILPPYQVLYTPQGTRVALIGVVTDATPRLVQGEGIADVEFLDEADAVNQWVSVLRDDGIEAIGVLLHEGGLQTGPAALDPNGCDQIEGPIVDINNRIDPAVDLIVSGFSHASYTCQLPVPGGQPRLVTQAGSYGQLVTDIRLTLTPGTGDVDRAATYSAFNMPVARGIPDASVQAVVDYWTAGPGNGAGVGAVARSTEAAPASDEATDTENRPAWLAALAILGSIGLGLAGWLAYHRRARERRHQPYRGGPDLAGSDRGRRGDRNPEARFPSR